MLSTANPWTFDPVRGTVDTLVYGGRLTILENPVTEVGHAGDIPVPAFVPKATAEDLLRVRSTRS